MNKVNKRWIRMTGLIAVVATGAAFLFFSHDPAQTALEETRRALRQQGFKIDLAEFDLSASTELRARATALTNADLARTAFRGADAARRARVLNESLDLMPTVGSNAAIVVWKQEKLPPRLNLSPWPEPSEVVKDLWPELREIFNEDRAALDTACAAAMSGPTRFDLAASRGVAMLLPHLAVLRNLTQTLGTRSALELHDGDKAAAWTNLLASSRLVTAWETEPTEISHMVRFACATLVYNATWQALQSDGWADDRLARLQHEWESADFFRGLPEAEAFARAGAAAVCQRDRQEPLGRSYALETLFRSPRNAWYGFTEHWYRIRYRHHGSYDDERALLLYYRDHELQVRRAVQAPTWSEMRLLPGVTNTVPFQSKYRSRVQALLNLRQMTLAWRLYATGGRGLLDRAAEAEARRRLVISAIALKRYRGRHGGYPKALQELVPELLQSSPVDFMDGKPLRYRLTADGHFVLYSVGLDCVDDGGMLPRRGRGNSYGPIGYDAPQARDLVWPRPASAAEIQAQQAEDERQAGLERAVLQERSAEAEKQAEIEQQAFVSTNLCQFDSAYDHFDARGGTLYARLPESNGVYTIELKAPAGAHIRTFNGATSNGVIRVHWDLLDDHGNRCTNAVIDSVFHVTLPGSGRSQTLKGP